MMTNDTRDADIAFIRALTEVLNETDLTEVDVTREWGDNDALSVRISRRREAAPTAGPTQAAVPVRPAEQRPEPGPAAQPAASEPAQAGGDPAQHPGAVTSPMVGTVYLAPEPGAASFVSIGDKVSEGQTLLIVEAMKTMNQISASKAGTVSRILVEDGAPVEYGAPLMIVE